MTVSRGSSASRARPKSMSTGRALEQDVGRLDVAVQDADGVDSEDRLGEPGGEVAQVITLDRALGGRARAARARERSGWRRTASHPRGPHR